MFCSRCGTQNADQASFCAQCGSPLGGKQFAGAELANMGRRFGSFLIDAILQAIPYLGVIPGIINLVMFRRGHTIGLRIVGARIVRENGDLSGFFHTSVRGAAAILSAIPFGLGFWWAIWDPQRRTWHDKLLHTHVMRDTEELASRHGSSSHAAVVWFWALLVVNIILIASLIVLSFSLSSFPGTDGGSGGGRHASPVPPPIPVLSARHVPDGQTVSYNSTPPTSGAHWDRWADCGIYDEEVPDERSVHNLEHGHVVISYNLSEADDIDRMKQLAGDLSEFRRWGVVRPYSKIAEGSVAMAAWGVIDQFQGVDEDRIRRFYESYRRNQFSPETARLGSGIPCSAAHSP